jgi:DNA recombination protein RmuC
MATIITLLHKNALLPDKVKMLSNKNSPRDISIPGSKYPKPFTFSGFTKAIIRPINSHTKKVIRTNKPWRFFIYNDYMSSDTYFILIFISLGLLTIYILLNKKINQPKQDHALTEWLKSIQSSLNASNQNITSTLQRSYGDLHERLETASRVIGELKKEAGTFSEIGRSMQDLQKFLQSPKLRGNIGEEVLKDLISQMFPKNSFHLQFGFKSGATVDAAIKTGAGILPIDSKFPMENFQKMVKAKDKAERKIHKQALVRDVRKHIRDISSKYILPEEDTLDFALMYIPSEAVYYEIVNLTELINYARESRVYPVSPTTLYSHLQTILLSFEGQKIESRSKQVFAILRGVKKDYSKLDDNLGILNRHLTNAYNQMGNAKASLNSLGQKISSTQTLSSGKN